MLDENTTQMQVSIAALLLFHGNLCPRSWAVVDPKIERLFPQFRNQTDVARNRCDNVWRRENQQLSKRGVMHHLLHVCQQEGKLNDCTRS